MNKSQVFRSATKKELAPKIAGKIRSTKNPVINYSPSYAKKVLTSARKEISEYLKFDEAQKKEWIKQETEKRKKMKFNEIQYAQYLKGKLELAKNSIKRLENNKDKMDDKIYTELQEEGAVSKGLVLSGPQVTFGNKVIQAQMPAGDSVRFAPVISNTFFDLPSNEKYYSEDYNTYKLFKAIEQGDKDYISNQANSYKDKYKKAISTVLSGAGELEDDSDYFNSIIDKLDDFQLEKLGSYVSIRVLYDDHVKGNIDKIKNKLEKQLGKLTV